MKSESNITGPVLLTMNCESVSDPVGSCRTDLNIADILKQRTLNQWHKISIDVNCFTEKGIKFENMIVPFELTSKDSVTLSISEITFEFDKLDEANMVCAQ